MPETKEQVAERMAKVRAAKQAKVEAPKEGESVDLGDSGKALYRDRSGAKLGGGPTEGQSYRDTVAVNATESVRKHLEAELAKLEPVT